MRNAIQTVFNNIKKENRPALLTFTVAGDNSLKKSQEIIEKISNNADIIELGFPHNTPIADGGQIQQSSYRALQNNINLNDIFKMVKKFKKKIKNRPLILMGYYNLIYRYGENRFLSNCKKFKVDGIIVVDLPWPENKKLAKKAKSKNICFVQLVSPTTSRSRVKKILKDSHEMVYYISMLSTTGGKLKISPKKIIDNYNIIKRCGPKKNIVIGFGITTKNIESLKKADGLVIGSELCKTISKSLKKRQNPVTNVSRIVKELKRKIS